MKEFKEELRTIILVIIAQLLVSLAMSYFTKTPFDPIEFFTSTVILVWWVVYLGGLIIKYIHKYYKPKKGN